MSLLSSTIPNFVNGISQQPYELRLTSQGESQVNGLSTVASGLRKRAPTEHLAKVSGSPVADAFVHVIDRDDTEQYVVVLLNGSLSVYDTAGNAKTVNYTDQSYLGTGAVLPSEAFAVTTVADYTFIVNKSKVTAAAVSVVAVRPYEALFHIKLGNYGKTYNVIVNGATAGTFATPIGTETNAPLQLSTDYIATQLMASMTTNGYAAGSWVLVRYGSVIHLKNTAGDFTCATEDGFGNTALVAIKRTIQKFADLPQNPRVDGFTVEIAGDPTNSFDKYWVKFDAATATGTGVWRETSAPGTVTGLDPLTMPHVLVREANLTFTFKPATWLDRKVGDITSNPNPSFVGQTIRDIFFFQNRLGFLSDENYVQSETGKYFNVFRTTVTTLLDSDPVDVNAATNKVALLDHAVEFNKQLILFSKQQQFIVDSTVVMTPRNVPIRPTTNFACNTKAKPVAAGRNIYFGADKGNWASVREFYAETISTVNDAMDVTAHVPKYIPAGIVKIAAGTAEDVLVLLSSTDRSKLFIYKYYFSTNEKLQSSWSHFTFDAGATILSCEFIRSVLFLVISRADGLYFEKMDFSLGASTAGEPYQVLLDRKRVIPMASLVFSGGRTRIPVANIGYTPVGTDWLAVTHSGGAGVAGSILPVVIVGTDVSVAGNWTTSNLTLGLKYTFSYKFSTLALRLGQKGLVDTNGRTQVRNLTVSYADSGYFRLLVTPLVRQTYTYVFSGAYLGTTSATLGTQSLSGDQFKVPVLARNTQVDISIDSDMPLPVNLLSATWEALYATHAKSV